MSFRSMSILIRARVDHDPDELVDVLRLRLGSGLPVGLRIVGGDGSIVVDKRALEDGGYLEDGNGLEDGNEVEDGSELEDSKPDGGVGPMEDMELEGG